MWDLSFDAVIVGGGTKALPTAMYLAKYGGMSVGIFEEKLELAGGWATEETPAPGFSHNTCSMAQGKYHHIPVWEDFPDFEVKGANYKPMATGCIFKEDQTGILIYNMDEDPTQELSAKTIRQYSAADAQAWLELSAAWRAVIRPKFLEYIYNPAKPLGVPDMMDELPSYGLDPHWQIMSYQQVVDTMFESPEMRFFMYRLALAWDIPIDLPQTGMNIAIAMISTEAYLGWGGSHSVCHAYQRILAENGAQTFTQNRVDQILVENGRAVGITLADGRQIEAKKLVVTNLSPRQLVDVVGKDNLAPGIVKKIGNLTDKEAPETWFGWAIHEAPQYKAGESNPDFNRLPVLTIMGEKNPERILQENRLRRAGILVPDPVLYGWCFTLSDPTQMAAGKQVAGSNSWALPATALSEKQWLKFKEEHAEYVIETWQEYAPNMTWDNVIGVDPRTPYDHCKLSNMRPEGNPAIIDHTPMQMGRYRPIPELAQHRVPGIDGLYPTGSAWPPNAAAWCCQGYNCYKIIAEDLDLAKPWEREGRPF